MNNEKVSHLVKLNSFQLKIANTFLLLDYLVQNDNTIAMNPIPEVSVVGARVLQAEKSASKRIYCT